MKENLDSIFTKVLNVEAGYVNNPNDNGGPTNFGITQDVLSAWRGHSVSANDVKLLQKPEAIQIYEKNYWIPIAGDSLPNGVDLILFDAAVNHSTSWAVNALQKAVGAPQENTVTVTTLALLGTLKPESIIFSVAEQRKQRYMTRDTYSTFGDGWKNRLNGIATDALKTYNQTWNWDGSLAAIIPVSPEVNEEFTDSQLQQELKKLGLYSGAIDGKIGNQSLIGITAFLNNNKVNVAGWTNQRLINGAKQQVVSLLGIDVGKIDGWLGDSSKQGFALYNAKGNQPVIDKITTWRDKVTTPPIITATNKNNWPVQADMDKFFGQKGENQTSITLPYKMKLAWDLNSTVTKMTIHEKCADSLGRILKNTYDHYGQDAITQLRLDVFGGSLNVRKMRGGTAWSIHSWGCAVDLDPERNQLKMHHDTAEFANPKYDAFWKFVAEEGWVSLGKARDFDFMHLQAARL